MEPTQSRTQSSPRQFPAGGAARWLWPALLLLAGGCTVLDPGSLPSGAVAMTPPPEFTDWWQRTEACSEISGDMAHIEWYVVPNARTFQSDMGEVVGLWAETQSGGRIILAGQYADQELVVRHEMLHDLLRRAGHPTEYFVDRCSLTWASWNNGEISSNGG